MNALRSFALSLREGLSPAEVLHLEPEAALRKTIRIAMAWILPLTLLVFLTAALNARGIEQALALSGASLQFQKFAPWNRLFFPVLAALVVLTAGGSRWVMLSVLDESKRVFRTAVSISALALLPLFAVLLGSSVIGNLFPSGGIQSGRIFFIATISLFTAALIYEAFITIRLCRTLFSQNTGRAVLTWGAFYGAMSFLCCGGGFVRMLL